MRGQPKSKRKWSAVVLPEPSRGRQMNACRTIAGLRSDTASHGPSAAPFGGSGPSLLGSGFLGLTPPGYELAPRSGLEMVGQLTPSVRFDSRGGAKVYSLAASAPGKEYRKGTTSFADLNPQRGLQMRGRRAGRSPGCDQTPPVMVPLPPPSGLGILTGRVGIPGADAARLCTCAPFGAGNGPSTDAQR